jgi:CheY-like chemotaxis protein
MSADTLANLFQPFTQGKSAQRKQGTGLGLAICKHLVELMAGHIIVNSHLGSGTRFRVELPLYIALEQQDTELLSQPLHASHLRVLVVEDNPINQIVINGMLEFLDIKADLCTSSEEALQRFEQTQGQYDVIFMDCELPDRDGFETTRLIRQYALTQNSLKIIALTAHSLLDHQQQAKQAGMDYFLSKPPRLEALEQVLRLILSHKTAIQ